MVDPTGPLIKYWTTTWRSESHGRSPVLWERGKSASTMGYYRISLVVGRNYGDSKKRRVEEGDEIDVTIEKVTFDS